MLNVTTDFSVCMMDECWFVRERGVQSNHQRTFTSVRLVLAK